MSDTLLLRLARPADLSAVDRLLARSYPKLLARDYPPSTLVTAVPRLARANPGLIASGRYWLACDAAGGVLAAGGWSGYRRGQGAGIAQIRHVATDPAAVRRGIGSALLSRAMRQAEEEGFRLFDCLATRTAVPFYASLGFAEIGPVDIPLAPGISFAAVRMVRRA